MSRHAERGSALLAVLLVVAAVGALATVLLARARGATSLARAALATEQARFDIAGVAALARLELAASSAATGEINAGMAGNGLAARTAPAGNCFNLNGLVQGGDDGPYRADPAGAAPLARLAELSRVDRRDAEALAARTVAAIGATGLLTDPREAGSDDSALAPWLCALPAAEPGGIDADTLTAGQAPLLAMALPSATLAAARSLIEARPAGGWRNATAFAAALQAAGLPASDGAGVVFGGRWRWLTVTIDRPPVRITETLLIDTARRPARVVARRYGS